MKKYFGFAFIILLACNNSSTAMNKNLIADSTKENIVTQKDSSSNSDSVPQKNNSKVIGGDKDDHGCLASAGYRWSEAKQDCVRLFEIGIRLQPIEKTDNSSDGFLVFSDDKTKAELFVIDESKPILLKRFGSEGNYVWKKDAYELSASNDYVVKKNGKAIYQAQ